MSCCNLMGGLATIHLRLTHRPHEATPAMKSLLHQRSISPHNPCLITPLQSNETCQGFSDTDGMQMECSVMSLCYPAVSDSPPEGCENKRVDYTKAITLKNIIFMPMRESWHETSQFINNGVGYILFVFFSLLNIFHYSPRVSKGGLFGFMLCCFNSTFI